MCPDLLTQLVDSSALTVGNYKSTALEGHMVNFSCPFGESASSFNTSTCTRDGQWAPDPKEINCDNDMMTTRKAIIPNSQQLQMMSILVGSLLGILLLMITAATIMVAFLLKRRVKGLYITH